MTPSDRITQKLAERLCESVATRTIRVFQKVPAVGAIGDGHGLKSVWEEMCYVLREVENGNLVYDGCISDLTQTAAALLKGLERHEKCAIWLQTDAGAEWESEIENECAPDRLTYSDEEIADHVVSKYIVRRGLDWTNERIRRLEDSRYDPADMKWESSLFENPEFRQPDPSRE